MRGEDVFEEFASGRSAVFRRRLTLTAVVAVMAVIVVSAGLAVRQYRDSQRTLLDSLRSRTVVAAAVVNAYFLGDISTLEAAAQAPPFVSGELPQMGEYLRRLERPASRLFNGGIGWIDRSGVAMVRSSAAGSVRPVDVADRSYFRRVLATGKPFVSGGLVGRRLRVPVVVVAVPTRGKGGRVTGVLAASIQLRNVQNQKAELDLGYAGLAIIDRRGRLLLSGLAPVRNRSLLAGMAREPAGVVSGTHGLSGAGDDVVAYTTAAAPGWRIVIDRPSSAVFASARRSLLLELGSVGLAALVVIAMVGFVVLRSRRDSELQEGRARAWTQLTRELAGAVTPGQVETALVDSVATAFPNAIGVVVFEGGDQGRDIRTANVELARRVAADAGIMEEIARRATSRRGSFALEQSPILGPAVALSGGRFRRLSCVPVLDGAGGTIGGIALLRPGDGPLETGEWALLTSFAQQAARAFTRSRRFEHDHRLAVRLQRNLLPEALPDVAGVALAGHYRAGTEGFEVGGDWYEAVRREDGILLLCVGDVIGSGIGAATLMGRHRDAFRAHAQETPSPAEILRRLLRGSIQEEMMITVACVSLDSYTGELAYARAGHPPPLLIDCDSREVVRLEHAGAPPLGIADAASIHEEWMRVPERATIVLYSDGLVERRGQSIDLGIDVLAEVVSAGPAKPIEEMIADVCAVIGPVTDDIALLIARLTGEAVPFELELSARPGELPEVRRRLRAWLIRGRFAPGEADEILLAVAEACNNSIEHAYDEDLGSISISVEDDGERLKATVRDRGRWRTGRGREDRGRGIAIMKAVMDQVEFDHAPDGTTVTLVRCRRGPVPLR